MKWLRRFTHRYVIIKPGVYGRGKKIVSKPILYVHIGRDLCRDYPLTLTVLWGLRGYADEGEMLYNGEFRLTYKGLPFSFFYYNNKESPTDEQA